MSHRIFGLALLTLLLVGLVTWVSDAAPAESYDGIVIGDQVEVRAGAGRTFYVVGVLKKGDVVRVSEVIYGWFKIVPPEGTYSYIRKVDVNAKGDGSVGIINTAGARVIAGALEGPGTSYRRQTDLDKDAQVTILGEDGDFYRVKPPATAYVYLSPQSVRRATADDLVSKPAAKKADPGTGDKFSAVESAIKIPKPSAEDKVDSIEGGKGDIGEVKPKSLKAKPAKVDETTVGKAVKAADSADGKAKAAVADATKEVGKSDIILVSSSQALRQAELQFRDAMKLPLEQQPLQDLDLTFSTLLLDEKMSSLDKRIANARLSHVRRNAALLAAIEKVRRGMPTEELNLDPDPITIEDETTPTYDKVGQLLVSNVYNGLPLTKLYRLVDAATGQTIGYVRPGGKVEATFLGRIVGIRGESRYDPAMNLQIIDVERIDALGPDGTRVESSVTINEDIVFDTAE